MEEVDLPERFARRRVGQVDLDERPLDRQKRVAQGDARVGQPAGVDDRDIEVAPVQPIDEEALVVRLEEVDGQARAPRPGSRSRRDLARACPSRRSRVRGCRRGSDWVPQGPAPLVIRRPARAPAADPSLESLRARTVAASMSSRTITPRPSGEPSGGARGMLLVGGRGGRGSVVERVGERLGRELETVEQPARSVPPVPAASPRPRRRCGWRRAGHRRPPRHGAARRSRRPPRRRARASARD